VGQHKTEWRVNMDQNLQKSKSQWNATTYKWNDTQDEAYLLQDGATVPIAFVDEKGKNRTIGYKIPSRADCISCHRQNDKILPIGRNPSAKYVLAY
jgi:hypothetical protein